MPKLNFKISQGAGSVTGANFLLEDKANNVKFLFDCGLTQGSKLADDVNWEPFPYDPKEIDYLIISHAHIDHIGRIPKLVYDGFKGRIISTDATMALSLPMLEDTVGILGRSEQHDLSAFYNLEMLKRIMSMWESHKYHEDFFLGKGYHLRFLDAGHILGSSMLRFFYGNSVLYYTGDLGNSPSPLLRDTEDITDARYMIMESVYGDRNHESRNERKDLLAQYINENHKRRATLVMPTFSLERSQELLFEINELIKDKKIPVMPVFFDSPLAIKLTDVYENFTEYFNDFAKKQIKSKDDIFDFPGLHVTRQTEQSKAIEHHPNPKIIIAGSGMSNGGRIIHHEANYLPDKRNTILLTGYQSAGSMGRMIEEGAKTVFIDHQKVPVRAMIKKIAGYSGHKDSDHLLDFISKTAKTVEKVFVVLGEPKSSLFLAQKIKDNLGLNVIVPSKNDDFELEF